MGKGLGLTVGLGALFTVVLCACGAPAQDPQSDVEEPAGSDHVVRQDGLTGAGGGLPLLSCNAPATCGSDATCRTCLNALGAWLQSQGSQTQVTVDQISGNISYADSQTPLAPLTGPNLGSQGARVGVSGSGTTYNATLPGTPDILNGLAAACPGVNSEQSPLYVTTGNPGCPAAPWSESTQIALVDPGGAGCGGHPCGS